MIDVLQYVTIACVAVFLIWLPFRIDVHWASGDGRRFICRGQLRDDQGVAQGPWREYRVQVASDGEVVAYRRSLLGGKRGGSWHVTDRADEAPPRRAAYVLRPRHDAGGDLVIQLPARSRAVGVLDDLAARTDSER
jgi:hypothetical protein